MDAVLIDYTQLVFATIALLAMLVIVARRAHDISVIPTVPAKRVLIVDLILLAAALEGVLDTLAVIEGSDTLRLAATAARGAVMMGILGLALSYQRRVVTT